MGAPAPRYWAGEGEQEILTGFSYPHACLVVFQVINRLSMSVASYWRAH